jgi:hypothetical protein
MHTAAFVPLILSLDRSTIIVPPKAAIAEWLQNIPVMPTNITKSTIEYDCCCSVSHWRCFIHMRLGQQ